MFCRNNPPSLVSPEPSSFFFFPLFPFSSFLMSLSMASDPAPISNHFGSLSSANDIRVHPLASSPASGLYQGGQPLSSQMNGTGATNGQSYDDVTTIFVVGFPDDMSEREFQNMFTFSPGFEAASLKWHCKDQEDEQGGVGSNGGKKQMVKYF